MIRSLQKTIRIMTPLFTISLYAGSSQVVAPQIVMRSQGVSLPRHLSGISDLIHRTDQTPFYGLWSITADYSRSFNSKNIAQNLFGNDLQECGHIVISGSRVANRGAHDWLADYFYLPTDFQSILSFEPVIDNFIVDPMLYVQLDEWIPGLYFALTFPIVHSRWDLQLCERVINPGIANHDAGYFTADTIGIPRQSLLNNFSEYAQGATISPTNNVQMTIFDGLDEALIRPQKNIKSRIADIRANAGLDIINNETGRLSIYLEGAAPTGNKPEGYYLFEAIVGNNYHWEFGVGIGGQYNFWKSTDEKNHASLIIQATLTHLFGKQHRRTFDLIGKPLSRYMLAQHMTDHVSNLQAGTEPIAYQFDNQYAPLANLTTMPVDVTTQMQADMIWMLHATYECWSVDIGYNFWARSSEKIKTIPSQSPLAQDYWALKGDSYTFGFTNDTNIPVELSATESQADIHRGTNFTPTKTITQAQTNPGIDNPLAAANGSSVILLSQPSGVNQINTSNPPVLLSLDDISLVNTRGMTNGIFAHIQRTWSTRTSGWTPFIGIGGQVEFCNNTHTPCATTTIAHCVGPCIATAVSQWSFWIKGGASFE